MAKNVYTIAERKAQFLKAGIKVAKRVGIDKLSVSAVAAECKVTPPLIFHVYGNRDKFRAAIKAAARKEGVSVEPKASKTIRVPPKVRKEIKTKLLAVRKQPAARKPVAAKKSAPVTKAKSVATPKTGRSAGKVGVAKKSKSAQPASKAGARAPSVAPASPKPAVTKRKRSIKEVKAIKDKVAAFATLPVPSGEATGSSIASKP